MAPTQEKLDKGFTFYAKEQIICPVCDARFKREELKSGGGRLIAGDLTDELHRLYEPSAKYGEIFPLVYNITVCPKCYYAALPQDFSVLDKGSINAISRKMKDRYTSAASICGPLDFSNNRRLNEGAASYYLAMLCYEDVPQKFSPTVKRGLCSLRAAWLFTNMNGRFPGENYDYITSLFYHKALFFYSQAIALEATGKEMISNLKFFGPDLDKNYGFDGVLYMAALLEYRYGSKTDPEKRKELLSAQRRSLAKMFGLGKSSKNKPGPLLEHARSLYNSIVAELGGEDE